MNSGTETSTSAHALSLVNVAKLLKPALHLTTAFDTVSEIAPEVIRSRVEGYDAQRDGDLDGKDCVGMLDPEHVKRKAIRDCLATREAKWASAATGSLAKSQQTGSPVRSPTLHPLVHS